MIYKTKITQLDIIHLNCWQREEKLPVKTSRPSQCRVDGVDSVGGSDEQHITTVLEPVHQGQQGGHDGGVDLVLLARANRRQTVELVEENDGWTHLVRLKHFYICCIISS